MTDYDRSNPVTAKEATVKYLDYLQMNEQDAEKLKELEERRNQYSNKNVIELLAQYGQRHSLEQRVARIEGELDGVKINVKPRANKVNPNLLNPEVNNKKRKNTIVSKQLLPSNTIRVIIKN